MQWLQPSDRVGIILETDIQHILQPASSAVSCALQFFLTDILEASLLTNGQQYMQQAGRMGDQVTTHLKAV